MSPPSTTIPGHSRQHALAALACMRRTLGASPNVKISEFSKMDRGWPDIGWRELADESEASK